MCKIKTKIDTDKSIKHTNFTYADCWTSNKEIIKRQQDVFLDYDDVVQARIHLTYTFTLHCHCALCLIGEFLI